MYTLQRKNPQTPLPLTNFHFELLPVCSPPNIDISNPLIQYPVIEIQVVIIKFSLEMPSLYNMLDISLPNKTGYYHKGYRVKEDQSPPTQVSII